MGHFSKLPADRLWKVLCYLVYRWNALPMGQQEGMKNFISDVIVKVTASLPSEDIFNFISLLNCWFGNIQIYNFHPLYFLLAF